MKPLIPYFDATDLNIFKGITVKTPGLLLVLGLAAGTYAAMRKARRDGLQAELIISVVPWFAAGIFIGGHLGELLFYHPETLIADPASVLRLGEGLSSFGGVLGIWFFRREARKRQDSGQAHLPPLNIWSYADSIMYGFTPAWFFGRMGCFSVHDHPGTETEFWLGFYGICPSGRMSTACHDLGLYEGICSLVFFILFVFLDRKPRFPGFFVGLLAGCYGLSRFMLETLRHPEIDARYFGLTPAQYGSIALVVLGGWVITTRRLVPPVRK